VSLKICHIISGDLWAGAEVMALSLLRNLKKYPDLILSVIILNNGKLANEIKKENINCYILDENKQSIIEILKSIRRINKNNMFDITHSHRYKENMLACVVKYDNPECKMITTVHGINEYYNKNNTYYQSLKKKFNYIILSHKYDKVITVSEEIRIRLINEENMLNQKVYTIHNGIKIKEHQNDMENEMFTIGSAGRLVPVKDFTLMVKIASILIPKYENVYFKIAGDGPKKNEIDKEIKKYNLKDRFILKGNIECMDTFYKSINLYINTSIHEGIPITVLEAMANCCPVIAPRIGGLGEIIDDGKDGFLLESRNPEEYAKKIEEIMNSNTYMREMGFEARKKIINKFSEGQMSENYYKLYQIVQKE